MITIQVIHYIQTSVFKLLCSRANRFSTKNLSFFYASNYDWKSASWGRMAAAVSGRLAAPHPVETRKSQQREQQDRAKLTRDRHDLQHSTAAAMPKPPSLSDIIWATNEQLLINSMRSKFQVTKRHFDSDTENNVGSEKFRGTTGAQHAAV